ncbi:MAG: hypothetical protein IPK33_33135 [Gemmatimonadetes bacterium]|nr:hypothetical protein [Gemmatimonadota bacterium]
MAQRYVDLTTAWLRGAGAHAATIPDFGLRRRAHHADGASHALVWGRP